MGRELIEPFEHAASEKKDGPVVGEAESERVSPEAGCGTGEALASWACTVKGPMQSGAEVPLRLLLPVFTC